MRRVLMAICKVISSFFGKTYLETELIMEERVPEPTENELRAVVPLVEKAAVALMNKPDTDRCRQTNVSVYSPESSTKKVVFRSRRGRNVTARVVEIQGRVVTLRRGNGGTFTRTLVSA